MTVYDPPTRRSIKILGSPRDIQAWVVPGTTSLGTSGCLTAISPWSLGVLNCYFPWSFGQQRHAISPGA